MSGLKSFEEYASFKAEEMKAQEEAHKQEVREETTRSFKELLAEYGVSKLSELDEETKTEFFSRLEESFGINQEELTINENYEVIFSDGVSQMKKFRSEAQALDFMKKTIASNKKLRDIAVYKPGMHSTTQTELVVKFWGDGSYLDNVSKKDPKLAAKKLEESVVNEDVFGDLEAAISDMDFDAYQNLASEFGVDTEDPNMMMDFIYNELDKKGAKLLIKNINKGVYESSGLNEAIVVTGKRDAKRVMTAYVKFFEKYPALGQKAIGAPAKHHVGAVRELYAEAMIDANFSRELPATKRAIPGVVYPIDVKVAELNNALIRISAGKLMDICAANGSIISGAAKFSGLAIVEGTAMYLDSIGYTKEAEDLMARFNKAFNESAQTMEERITEGNAFGSARAKAIAAGKSEFEVDGKTYKLKGVDADDKENAEEFTSEAFIGPFVFNDRMSDEKLLGMYNGALDGYANWQKGFEYPKSDYKKAYQEIEKILKKRGVSVDESVVTEAEIKSDDEFKEYAFTVLQKAFGEDFDDAKAQEVVDGILSKSDGDYGAAVGMLTSSLG